MKRHISSHVGNLWTKSENVRFEKGLHLMELVRWVGRWWVDS